MYAKALPPKQRLVDLDEIRVNTLGNVADARKLIMSTCMYLHMYTYVSRFCVMCALFVSALTHTHTYTQKSKVGTALCVSKAAKLLSTVQAATANHPNNQSIFSGA